MKLVLTCEHAGNEIPGQYRELFTSAKNELNSHRGYDPGAFDLFQTIRKISDYNFVQKTSRLLVEVNRSLHHPQLFSEFTRNLPIKEKNKILSEFYYPYRNSVEKTIDELQIKHEKILHLSIHTFTPELNGVVRNAGVGLLFDPKKPEEKQFCRLLKKELLQQDQTLVVRYNYPYLGKADGFTTYLRRKFPHNYLGIELEVNQKYVRENILNADLKLHFFRALSAIL